MAANGEISTSILIISCVVFLNLEPKDNWNGLTLFNQHLRTHTWISHRPLTNISEENLNFDCSVNYIIGFVGDERKVQKNYWIEHSVDLTVEAMMLDSKATDIDKEERPEVIFPFFIPFFVFCIVYFFLH